jgi:hypothetical protein
LRLLLRLLLRLCLLLCCRRAGRAPCLVLLLLLLACRQDSDNFSLWACSWWWCTLQGIA